MASETSQANRIPERAAPDEMSEHLMESEHRGRYQWAAQLAAERDVLDAGCGTGYGTAILAAAGASRAIGIDISQEAIDYARSSSTQSGAEFSLGDLHELPFADGSFDVAVCFEAIEHVERQALAIAELRRVLRPAGVLVISSPNRNVYPPGNPHHTHEFVPEELERTLAEQFSSVRLYRQSPWLAAAVLDDEQSGAVGAEREFTLRAIKIAAVEPGEEAFTIALASNRDLTDSPGAVALLGKPFEVRWWQEQLATAQSTAKDLLEEGNALRVDLQRVQDEAEQAAVSASQEAARERAVLQRTALAAQENGARSARRLLEVESDLAGSQARGFALDAALDAHIKLAHELQERLARADRVMAAMKRSVSWRVTAPLRALKRRR